MAWRRLLERRKFSSLEALGIGWRGEPSCPRAKRLVVRRQGAQVRLGGAALGGGAQGLGNAAPEQQRMTRQRSDDPQVKPYSGPAGGWGSVRSLADILPCEHRVKVGAGDVLILP
jgi:hypothetical protein